MKRILVHSNLLEIISQIRGNFTRDKFRVFIQINGRRRAFAYLHKSWQFIYRILYMKEREGRKMCHLRGYNKFIEPMHVTALKVCSNRGEGGGGQWIAHSG